MAEMKISLATSSSDPRRGKRAREYSESKWPKRRAVEEANTITSTTIGKWAEVSEVMLGQSTRDCLKYAEHRDTQALLKFALNTFELATAKGAKFTVACKVVDTSTYRKARLLITSALEIPMLKVGEENLIKQHSAGAINPTSDSDDEQVPTSPVVPAFTTTELSVVQSAFDRTLEAYRDGMDIGFTNCIGKNFAVKICEYVDTCCWSGREHKCLISTATGPTQPGACYIKWETPPRHIRSESDAPVVTLHERYADAIVYSKASLQNKVVIEIKDEIGTDKTAEAQHNEQMVGLWRCDQHAMLGLEFYSDTVQPKVLLRLYGKDVLNMFYLPRLKLEDGADLLVLTELLVAFMVYVKCSL